MSRLSSTGFDWRQAFPDLAASRDPGIDRIMNDARLLRLEANQPAFHDGAQCESYLLVVEGSVRVQAHGKNGRDIVLYRVNSGQPCILTTSCLLAGDNYPAEGVTETEVTAIALPAGVFYRGVNESDAFRRFVFRNYGQRLAALIERLEEVAFDRIETRLAQALLAKRHQGGPILATHQDLASELGTAREVVSRELKRFQTNGWVRLGRGSLEILDAEGLRQGTSH